MITGSSQHKAPENHLSTSVYTWSKTVSTGRSLGHGKTIKCKSILVAIYGNVG